MHLIALTGGIASGKSLVASLLRQRGAVHIDADALAREVVEPGTDALAEIAAEFGEDVILADGSLDRAALGAIVFSDPDRLSRLNAITHPRVRQLTADLIEAAAAADPHAVVVYDVPLLAESRAQGTPRFDRIVVVHADADERVRRMVDNRGMSREEALSRIAAQASDAERLAIADIVLDNTGDIASLERQVDELWSTLAALSD